MKNLGIAISSAVLVTLGLFYFMSQLVTSGKGISGTSADGPSINFVRMKQDSSVQERKREVPKKPEPPEDPPPMEQMKVAQTDVQQQNTKMDMPDMNVNSSLFGDGPFLGGAGGGSGDGDVMPIVRIEPQYPRQAAMKGIEGWVQLKFDVTPTGTVTNVDIVKSKPRRIFNSSARRALLKWKYQPKVEDGKPVMRKGLLVQLDFKLEN